MQQQLQTTEATLLTPDMKDVGARLRHNPALSWWAAAAGPWSLLFPLGGALFPCSLISRHFSDPVCDSSAWAQCSDSASVKVKCFYCSHASLSLTSSCSALPSLQNRVPWDPSAPLLDGTSDTSGKQERIKSPRVYKCIWKMSVEGWSHATNPRWHAGNICPERKKEKKKGCEDVIDRICQHH